MDLNRVALLFEYSMVLNVITHLAPSKSTELLRRGRHSLQMK